MNELTLSLGQWRARPDGFPIFRLKVALQDGLRRGESRVYLGRKDDTDCYLLVEEERHHA